MLRARSKKGGPNALFGSPHMAKHDALVAHIHYMHAIEKEGNGAYPGVLDILFMHTKEPCLSSVKPQPRPDRPVTRHTRPITNNVRRARLEPDPDPHNLVNRSLFTVFPLVTPKEQSANLLARPCYLKRREGL